MIGIVGDGIHVLSPGHVIIIKSALTAKYIGACASSASYRLRRYFGAVHNGMCAIDMYINHRILIAEKAGHGARGRSGARRGK